MLKKNSQHVDEIEQVVSEVRNLAARRDRFIEAGRLLREFFDGLPSDTSRQSLLPRVARASGIGVRTAHHWIEIDKAFSPLDIPKERLSSIGWAKLIIVARHLREGAHDKEVYLKWLAFVETHTLSELKYIVRGGNGAKRSLLLTFGLSDYAVVVRALIAHGARPSGGGRHLNDKEDAILRICRRSLQEQSRSKSAGIDA